LGGIRVWGFNFASLNNWDLDFGGFGSLKKVWKSRGLEASLDKGFYITQIKSYGSLNLFKYSISSSFDFYNTAGVDGYKLSTL